MENERCKGIKILAVYILLCTVPALFASFIGGISGSYPKGATEGAVDIIMRILFISSPVLFITAGIGLLKLKNWARLMTMFLSPALSFIAIGIFALFLDVLISPKIASLIIPYGVGVMAIGIIVYLTRPKVKEQFK
jgi:hypothetical protein